MPEATDPDYEATLAGGVHLLDVSDQLPTRGDGWGARSEPVQRLYLHHSGRLGRPGFDGLSASARYSVSSRGWAGCPYHYWVPYGHGMPEDAPIQVYRANADDRHSWHTGLAANASGIGIVLQGDLRSQRPSAYQIEALEALIPWLQDRHLATLSADRWLSWHSESGDFGGRGKASCPGPHVEAWAREWRANS
jgi:hypothetical protein